MGWRGAGGNGASDTGCYFFFGGLLMVLGAVGEVCFSPRESVSHDHSHNYTDLLSSSSSVTLSLSSSSVASVSSKIISQFGTYLL